MAMTGAAAVTESLLRNGVATLFALPGVQNDPLFYAFAQRRREPRVIHTRHEQGASYMALGYAQSTGRPGVYCVVPGPGVLNTTAALCTAYATNAPVFCLSGQIRSDLIGKNTGQLHELPDQLAILKGLTKFAACASSVADVPRKIDEAFAKLSSGRPRPVAVEVPTDILAQTADVSLPDAARANAREPLDRDCIKAAARLLGAARRPVIVVGGGAMDAGVPLIEIAELLQAPIVYNRMGKGAVSDSHPLCAPKPLGSAFLDDADAILAVGTRLADLAPPASGAGRAIVRLEIDPEEARRNGPPAVLVEGDAKDALAALAEILPAHNRSRQQLKPAMLAMKRAFDAAIAEEVGPQVAWLNAIRSALPANGIFVDEATQVGYCARFAFPVDRPRSFITTGYQGTLGAGFPTALGAQVAHPQRQVVSVNGDGGFMFNLSELSTAVQQRIPLIVIIFTDNSFANVRRNQDERYGGRRIAVELHNPDFVRLAETFGCAALRANTPAALERAVDEGTRLRQPLLIEVPVGEMPSPWPLLHGRKRLVGSQGSEVRHQ